MTALVGGKDQRTSCLKDIPQCTWTIRRPAIHERLQEVREMYNGRETTSIRKE